MANTSVMTDDKGNPSSSRWMCGITMVSAIAFYIVACCKPAADASIPVAIGNSLLAYSAVRGVGGKCAEMIGA
jgi:hypothetical protein